MTIAPHHDIVLHSYVQGLQKRKVAGVRCGPARSRTLLAAVHEYADATAEGSAVAESTNSTGGGA